MPTRTQLKAFKLKEFKLKGLSMDDKELRKIENQITAKGEEINDRAKGAARPTKYGLCCMCTHFHYFSSIYDKEKACCSKIKMRLSSIDRIKNCIDYFPFNQPDLYDMAQIAHILDVDKKGKIGF